MYTFQDFKKETDREGFLSKLIAKHESSDLVKTARVADEYDHQKNTLIRNFVQMLYTASGTQMQNVVASNNKRASNMFRRLNVQRNTYSIGNGVTFSQDSTKDAMGGSAFDAKLKQAGYKALIHGVSFLFLNVDHVHVFPVTEFAPLYDEMTGALRAGVRYWRIDKDKPGIAVLYEEDGYTVYTAEKGTDYKETEKKRGYKRTLSKAPADDAPVIVGEENYSALPIVPLWGSELKQSTLIGLKDGIDNYDLISNGWCNDIRDCAQVYWLLENYGGMNEVDKAKLRSDLLYHHIAVVDTQDGGKVKPYTQEIPYEARQAYLNMLKADIYEDFGNMYVKDVGASAKTATEIRAAYQPMDENADDFEYQIIECVHGLLQLVGIEDTPEFKRNRIANQMEEVEMVMMEANYLDDETVLDLLPNITPDMKDTILKRRDANAAANLSDMDAIDDAMNDDLDGGEA